MKKLKIDTMLCDCRNVSEEFLKQYGQIQIDSMMVFVDGPSMELMSRYNVKIDAMSIEKLEEDVYLDIHNGSYTIEADTQNGKKIALFVNGKLTIAKGAEEALKDYTKITVNGGALYPKSYAGLLAGVMMVNGGASVYPDEAVLIQGDLELDQRSISKMGEGGLYYVTGKVLFLDQEADYEKLREKNIRIETGRAIVRQDVQDLAEQIVSAKKWTVIPENCAYCRKGAVLNENFLIRYGSRVYVDGSLTVEEESFLSQMELLEVRGNVILNEKEKEAFLKVCRKFGDLIIYNGKLLANTNQVVIDAQLLEEAPDRINMIDCANIDLKEGITKEQIQQKLRLINCANIRCPQELVGTVQMISKDSVNICGAKAPKQKDSDPDCIYIDAMQYVM